MWATRQADAKGSAPVTRAKQSLWSTKEELALATSNQAAGLGQSRIQAD